MRAATTTPTARERLTLSVLLTASFTLAVDFSILNVALPDVGADVGFSLENLQWIATSFALCAAGFTLLFGRVADLFGRRRLFLAGIALLGVSSLVGGLADTPWVLLVARVAQGTAAAIVTPAALSLLTTSFPEGPRRERALGLNGALMAAGFTTGAVLGGVLTDLLSWRWAFYVNVVVALAVLVVGPAVLTESRPTERPRLDLPGALSVTAGLLALVYGLTAAGEHSWAEPRALVGIGLGDLPARSVLGGRAPGRRAARLPRRAASAFGGLGEPRRGDGVRDRDVARVPAHALPAERARLLTPRGRARLRRTGRGHRGRRPGRSPGDRGRGEHPRHRRWPRGPGGGNGTAGPAGRGHGLPGPGPGRDLRRRGGQPGGHRRVHGHRHHGCAGPGAGAGDRAGHDEPAGRHHHGHPDHVRDRHRRRAPDRR